MTTLGITESACPRCRRLVPAKITSDGRGVYFEKFCPEHGLSRVLVRSGLEDYLSALGYVKPAWVPQEHRGRADVPCPEGCGFCPRHEQHLCMPIIEITTRCDLSCPVCLVDAGGAWDISREEFRHVLDAVLRAEKQIDVLNLSGGEPLLHPDLLALLDEVLRRPQIVRASISTNGLALLERPELVAELKKRNVVVSLQFDGFDDRVYEALRGRRLLAEKRAILQRLAEADVSTSLTVTAADGAGDQRFGAILDYFFTQPHVVSMMIQPLAFTGRAAAMSGRLRRLTIPDVVRLLAEAGDPRLSAGDFAPLPCSHPLCFHLAYYLMLDDGSAVAVNRLVDACRLTDCLANRTIFGLDEQEQGHLRDLVYDLWSAPAASVPESQAVMKTLRSILDALAAAGPGFDPRLAFQLTERRIKSIFIHAFQDADTLDLARVRRCCHAYVQPDGRLIPPCVRNVLQRPANGRPAGKRPVEDCSFLPSAGEGPGVRE